MSARSGGGFGGSITLSFRAANYDTARTVYVRGNADDDTVDETNIAIAHAARGGYDGITAGSLSVSITDTSTPGLVISPLLLPVKENTDWDHTVRLTTQQASNVTVSVSRAAGSSEIGFDADGDGAFETTGTETLTFSNGNWRTPQAVKVRAPADVPADATATLSHKCQQSRLRQPAASNPSSRPLQPVIPAQARTCPSPCRAPISPLLAPKSAQNCRKLAPICAKIPLTE